MDVNFPWSKDPSFFVFLPIMCLPSPGDFPLRGNTQLVHYGGPRISCIEDAKTMFIVLN